MMFSRSTVFAAALLLVALQFDKSCVSSLSLSGSSSRRDVLAKSAGVAIGAATTLTNVAAVHAADTYLDGPEGLKYVVTNEGSGPKPERGQKIETSYTLWINGFPGEEEDGKKAKQIDSSKKIYGDQPFAVRAGVSQVIRGWDLSLLDMAEGESRKLVVPSSLGYGAKGIGPIPGGATLYFEMTLTKVSKEELTPEAKKWLEEHPL